MPTLARPVRIRLRLTATFVACAIFGLATIASGQQPSDKIPSSERRLEIDALTVNGGTALISPDGSTISGRLDEAHNFASYSWSPSQGVLADAGLVLGAKDVEKPSVVSEHGSAAAGLYVSKDSKHDNRNRPIYVWTKAGGVQNIGVIGNSGFNFAPAIYFVSDDGSVVVGTEFGFGGKHFEHLFRWTKSEGVKDFGSPESNLSLLGASADGSVLVGTYDRFDKETLTHGPDHAFCWTRAGGFQDIAGIDLIRGVSADGSAVFGWRGQDLVRWTQTGGTQDLGAPNISGTMVNQAADLKFGVMRASADGSAIIGTVWSSTGPNSPVQNSFIWTQAGGLQDISDKRKLFYDISNGGKVVAGLNFPDDSPARRLFASPAADLVAARQAQLKQQQAQMNAQVQAKAKAAAEDQAKAAAVAADQEARCDKVMKTGRPAQIYALAGHMEDDGRPDLAATLYQALIDKYPDDPYTAKAIDKQDASRAAAAQQQQQAQDPASQTATTAATSQNVEACLQQCNSTLNSCKSDAQTQHDSSVAKGLVGLISRNSGMVGSAGTDSQSADSAKSACADAYNSCSSSCQ